MKELSYDEYHSYFFSTDAYISVRPYFGEVVSIALADDFDLKYFEKGRWWYSEWNNHCRKVINLFAAKGTMYPIVWGYNYDFIPRLNNQDKFVYHRTEKSFATDIEDTFYSHVHYDPNTMSRMETLQIRAKYCLPSDTNNLEIAREYVYDVVKRNIPFMKEWFSRVQTIEDVVEELDRQIAQSIAFEHRYSLYTKAFLLAKLHRMDEAIETMQLRYGGKTPEKVLKKLYQVNEME